MPKPTQKLAPSRIAPLSKVPGPKHSLGPLGQTSEPDRKSDEVSAPLGKRSEPSLEFVFESACKFVPRVSDPSREFVSELTHEFVPDLALGEASGLNQEVPVPARDAVP